ncbi:hypothetical protein BN1723_010049 [Verticillium longisporum]|uniref:Major facilitator superfamily (MFS) profile domain-containing protein n=1 Tax=Verticillium longisporum TaxID=100787 RepID=A0A0G4KUW5_VERLO|nr:hypothetical protein BN1723_010049 [Verticillium longisporum]CRK20496.1 hypothetical protein BN1708_012886 [Verticillium longisporum]
MNENCHSNHTMDTSSRVYLETRTRTSEHDVEIDETAQDSDGSNSYGIAFSDPTKLSSTRKLLIVVAGFICTFNGNLGSSMPSGALDAISSHFGVNDRIHLILLNSLYMVGYVLGPPGFGPLSEYVGRRPVLIGTYLGYIIFMGACSIAPSYDVLLVFRLACGINAAAPTAVLGGLYADILDDPSVRGNAMALYMSVTTIGPIVGPTISGASSSVSWRWPFWIATLIAIGGLPLVLALPETYSPVLYNKAIRKRMKQNASTFDIAAGQHPPVVDARLQAPELKPLNAREIFLRPLTLLVTEPILFFTSVYLTMGYAVFYLMFQAYPQVFQRLYGLRPGIAGLAYLPMILGVIGSLAIFAAFTSYHDKRTRTGASWTEKEIYRRLPLACIASPFMVIGLFWLGWTARVSVHPVVPAMSGVFFVCGFQLLFMGMVNYLTDVFRQSSASAHAAASMMRSIGAILLPLSADSMYNSLGVHWAPSLVGFIALALGVIPFIFIKFGDRLAENSHAAERQRRQAS